MKKIILFILFLCTPLLSACGSIYSNFREVEQIKVIQTMGIDYIPGGVRLSLSSASGENGEKDPMYFESCGSSISEALDKIKVYSSEADLFFAHISRILIGEEAAQHGIEAYLAYVCRSPELRIDIPVFIVKGETAAGVMKALSSGKKGVSGVLEAAEANISDINNSQIISTSEIINHMDSQGSTAVCALEFTDSAQQSEESSENEMTAAISGYAVMKDWVLISYIDLKDAVGLGFLLNRSGISNITVNDKGGKPVTMELSRGSSRLAPIWDSEGLLVGIDVYAEVSATVLEIDENEGISMDAMSDSLLSGLEAELSSRIAAVLQLSRHLQSDFLGLGRKIELLDPVKYRSMPESFTERLPVLELRLSVSGELCHTKDIKGA